jgi:hypothetical protein
MRPTQVRLSNYLVPMPEDWNAPARPPLVELPSVPPLSWINSPGTGSSPQAVLSRTAM